MMSVVHRQLRGRIGCVQVTPLEDMILPLPWNQCVIKFTCNKKSQFIVIINILIGQNVKYAHLHMTENRGCFRKINLFPHFYQRVTCLIIGKSPE